MVASPRLRVLGAGPGLQGRVFLPCPLLETDGAFGCYTVEKGLILPSSLTGVLSGGNSRPTVFVLPAGGASAPRHLAPPALLLPLLSGFVLFSAFG